MTRSGRGRRRDPSLAHIASLMGVTRRRGMKAAEGRQGAPPTGWGAGGASVRARIPRWRTSLRAWLKLGGGVGRCGRAPSGSGPTSSPGLGSEAPAPSVGGGALVSFGQRSAPRALRRAEPCWAGRAFSWASLEQAREARNDLSFTRRSSSPGERSPCLPGSASRISLVLPLSFAQTKP
ncbi:MAG: hypothetical protein ACI84D_003565 [Thalassolituus oleivorans]|jgi:hypothetical protein